MLHTGSHSNILHCFILTPIYAKCLFYIQGPGTSALFALKCVEVLCGRATAEQVAGGMLVSMDGI